MFGQVDRLPGAPQLHRWADWAEILAYTSAGGTLSMPEFAETTERRKDFIETESEDDQDQRDIEKETLIAESRGDSSKYRDALAERAGDVLVYLKDRAARYGVVYPFEVDTQNRTLSLRESSDSRRLYLFILSCACFRYVKDPADRTSLAAKFELLSLEALKEMMPSNSEVHLFGSNSIENGRYKGLLYEKIKHLAKDLGEQVIARESDFERNDTGDNGLDLVAWVPSRDQLPGRIVVYAQVACTPQWVSKQHSSHASSWASVMNLTADPVNMVFIPFDYRRPGDDWYTRRHIHKSVVADRYRIITLLASQSDPHAGITVGPDLLSKLDLSLFDIPRGQDTTDL